MKALLHSLLEAATLGRPVVLCTVVHSGGSAPRSAGAHMAVFADGSTRGTVGGGRLELLAAKEGLSLLQRQTSALRAYDLSEREGGIGMACGGNVIVSYLYLGPEQADFVRAMAAAFDATAPCWLKLVIAEDGRTDVSLSNGADRSLCAAQPVWMPGTPAVYTEPLTQPGRVYLFGAGHVGRALAPVLRYVGFEVTVYDNRAELASPAHFPTAHEIVVGDFRRIFDKVSLTADDYAVVMTPGHQADYEILEQVLRTPATYIGCIGSRKKVALTRERLAAAGFSQQDIDRVRAPIGLPILAETPEEIAISVAAEMIRHRAEHL